MMNILEISNLSKTFGANKVIDDLSFSVPEQSVFGFIGQNGAGKTTTMKMLLGLLKPDSGNVTVCGEPVTFGQTKTNKYIGYLPDVPEFYGYMKPFEYLKLCGEITGLANNKIKSKSEELLSLVGLEKANKRIGSFSRGMKQRLGIAQALLNEPRLLICDEPTSALDPIGRKEILDILHQVKGKTTVVFSTHILFDVERICDYVGVLHEGKLVLAGTLSEIKSQHKQDGLLIEFASQADKNQFTVLPQFAVPMIKAEQTETSVIFHTHAIKETEALAFSACSEKQIMPMKIEVLEPTLESLFMEVVQ
jgi:ABC-2 type transport system ATP-binding protein